MGLFDHLIPSSEPPAAVVAAPSHALDPRSRELAIRTVLGEAANEPDEGMAGVAAVIRNRVTAGRYGGSDIPRVVMAPAQFEPWGTQAGRDRMMSYSPDSDAYKRAAAAVDRVFGEGADPTNGATHFYSPTAQAALGRGAPSWAQGEGQPIGRHTFFAPEGRVPAASPPHAPTDVSAQARVTPQATGLFNHLIPPEQAAAPPEPTEQPLPADTGGKFLDEPGKNFRAAREGQSPLVATKGEALKSGVLRGATFNFLDELYGLAAAGGLDPKDENVANAIAALAKGAYRRVTGDPEADAAYRVTASQERETAQRMQEQQPGASLAGEVAGGLLTIPFTGGAGAVAKGATAGERFLGGARVGAAYGGLSGAGAGDGFVDRAAEAAKGAAFGGATGAAVNTVLPPVMSAVARPFTGGAEKAAVPTAQELKAAAVAGFRSPEVAELSVRPVAIREFAADVRSGLIGNGFDEALAPKAFTILGKVGGIADDAAVTGAGLHTMRRTFGKLAGSADKDERAAAKAIIDAIDDFIPNVAATDIISGDPRAAAEAWALARGNYAAAMRSEDVARAVLKATRQADAAGAGGNIDNATRSQFRSILNNDKKLRGFNDEEIAQMEAIVRGTTWGNVMRLAGKAAPTGIVSGALSGGAGMLAGGPTGAVLVPLAGYVAKKLGDRSTAGQVQALDELVRSRAPLANAMEDFARRAEAFQGGQSATTFAAAMMAARNLSNNLKDAGVNLSPGEIIRVLQGPVSSRATEEQQ